MARRRCSGLQFVRARDGWVAVAALEPQFRSALGRELDVDIDDRDALAGILAYAHCGRMDPMGPRTRPAAGGLSSGGHMSMVRVALANLPFPETPDDSVRLALDAIREAGERGAAIVCFPECYVPGYRFCRGKSLRQIVRSSSPHGRGSRKRPPRHMSRWSSERNVSKETRCGSLRLLSIATGRRLGFHDKTQLDPSEDSTFEPGTERHVFTTGRLTFGISICHEGWRYPETVRWAAKRGAQVVFHPHFHEAEAGQLSSGDFRRSGEHLPREGRPVPRGGEHLFLRERQLRHRWFPDDIRDRAARWHAAGLPALRAARGLDCGSRPREATRLLASRDARSRY